MFAPHGIVLSGREVPCEVSARNATTRFAWKARSFGFGIGAHRSRETTLPRVTPGGMKARLSPDPPHGKHGPVRMRGPGGLARLAPASLADLPGAPSRPGDAHRESGAMVALADLVASGFH